MSVQTLSSSDTQFFVDRSANSIIFRRTFAASREDVFQAWTQPEHVSTWWDPTGARLLECEIDLRPGGSFRFVNRDHSPPFSGVYSVIDAPERLVFEALGALGTVNLEEAHGKTIMTVTIKCASPEHLDHFIQMGVAAGTTETLDNLVHYLGRREQ